MQADAFLYGQILMTNSLLLQDGMPPRDGYGELSARYRLIGGETGVAAAVLHQLGCSSRLSGTWLGRATRDGVLGYFADKNVDVSQLTYDDTFDGLEDFVLIDGDARTVFGTFGAFQSPEGYRWDKPTAEQLAGCRVAAIDPFFGSVANDVARLCVGANVPYVTIDCACDTYLAQHAAVIALSGEFLGYGYPGESREALLGRYTAETEGLVIFTAGSKPLLYGRRGQAARQLAPYRVKAESTLGAGDTFKAGCVYALLHGMTDEETVDFAAACAAAAVMRFPIPLNLPTHERIEALRKARQA